MAYSTTRAYIKSDGSSSDYFASGPHFGGVIRFTASRANHDSTSVTVNVDTYIGFGTYANTSSYTGYDVTGRAWYGATAWADRTAGTSTLIHDNADGNWNCTSSTASYFSAHDDDSNIDKKMKPTRKAKDIGSFTISDWTSGSKTVRFQLVNNGAQNAFSVSLSCPTYYTNGTATLSAADTSITYGTSIVLNYGREGGTNNAIDSWSLKEGSNTLTSGTGAGTGKTYTISSPSAGTHTYTLTVDFNKQGTVTKTVSVTVAKASSSFSLSPTSLSIPYNSSKTFTASWSHCEVQSYTTANTTIASTTRDGNTFTVTGHKPGSTSVTVKGNASNSNYSEPADKSVSITVTKINQSVSLSASSGTITYPNSTLTFTATATGGGSAAAGALSVSSNATGVATASISSGTVTVTRKGYGSATITVTAAATDYYNAASKTFTVTCSKRKITVTAPTLTTGTLTYNGSAKTLANAGSCTTGGTMYYYVDTSTTTPTFSTSTWSTSVPTRVNAGTYYVFWYCYCSDTTNNEGTYINAAYRLSSSRVIEKAANPITWGATGSWQPIYSTSAKSTSIVTPTNAQGTVTYSLISQKQGSTAVSYFSVNSSTGAITMAASTPANVYTIVVRATAAGNSNYNSGYKERTITVTEQVTITLNDNGGSGGSGTVTILYGTTAGNYPSVAKPVRDGYKFNGYYSATSGGTQWYDDGPSSQQTFNLTAPTTWYAQWTSYYVTVRYNVNGGTVTTGTGTTQWRASSGRLQRSTDSGSTWADVTHNVYTSNVIGDSTTNMWNVETPPIVKTGYHVVGTSAWNTAANGTGVDLNQDWSSSSNINGVTAYRLNGNAHLTSNKTVDVYPKWVANTYSVAFNANGGSGTMATQTGFSYGTGKALNTNTFTAPAGGYSFYGWATSAANATAGTRAYTNGGTMTTGTTTNGGTVTLYAIWSRTITFKSGQNSETSSTFTQYYGGYTAPPAITAISGWTALGWRDDTSAAGKEYGANNTTTFGYTGTAQTLYAVYSRTLTITYAANGGSGTTPSNTTTTQYYNSYNTISSPSVTLATNPYSRIGYSFDHWLVSTPATAVSSGGSYTWSIAIDVTATSRTATAQWTNNSYTISYNLDGGSLASAYNSTRSANGGTEAVNPTSARWDTYPAISGVTGTAWFYIQNPTKTGYTFNGWTVTGMDSNTHHYWYSGANTTSTATSWANTDNAAKCTEFYNLRATSGTVTFKANWTPIQYTLTIDPNGGNYEGHTASYTITQDCGSARVISPPHRPGFQFVGWAEIGPGHLDNLTNADPSFDTTSGGVGVYNNSGGGTVTITTQTSSAGYGSRELLIESSTGTTSPGCGGFVQSTSSAANKKFIHVFVAKLPVGYSVMNAQNATGDGRTITWLTSRAGTGKYQIYAYQHNCGTGGTFSSFGHVYVETGTKPLSWQVAYSAMTEITSGFNDTYTYGAGNGTLKALWAPKVWAQVDNTWKPIVKIWVQNGSAWEPMKDMQIQNGSSWKQVGDEIILQ